MAVGIHSKFGAISAPAALRGLAVAGACGRAWSRLRSWIARRRRRHALAHLNDWLLRDIGVIRERDIGVSREEARRKIDLSWPP
jgi:uncharacterized protein YjiS (DUF1127 family)